MQAMRNLMALVLGLTASAQQLGTVEFSNKIPGQVGGVDAPFHDATGVPLEGPDYVAELVAWTAQAGFETAWDEDANGMFRMQPVPFATNGYFFGSGVLVPVLADGSAWVQVRVWDVRRGATFADAALAGAWTGVSAVLFLPTTGFPYGVPPFSGTERVPLVTGTQADARIPRGPPSLPARLIGLQYPGPPLVVRHPQSQGVPVASQPVLSVVASSGVGAAYQWYGQPNDRPDGLIAGATHAAYQTPRLRTNGVYWVTVSNPAGTVTSERATLTVVSGSGPRLTVGLLADRPAVTVSGTPGTRLRIEQSTVLGPAAWSPWTEILLNTWSVTLLDTLATNTPIRLYRAVVQ